MSTLQADGEILDPRTVRFERLLPGPIERIWAYITESEKRRTWLAAGPMDLHAGGRVELRFNNTALTPHNEKPPEKYKHHDGSKAVLWTVTRCDAPRLLVVTWSEPNDSEVTFELAPRGDKVLLTITHRRLTGRDFMISVGAGWQAHLAILSAVLNDQAVPPFWSTHTALEAEYAKRITV